MQKISGQISSGRQKIKGVITSTTQSLTAKVGGYNSQYYYTKAEIDEFRAEDREYVNAQDLILQANIDASGHQVVVALDNETKLLTISLLDANNNVISFTTQSFANLKVNSASYNNGYIIFTNLDNTTFSVDITGLIDDYVAITGVNDGLFDLEVNANKEIEVLPYSEQQGKLSFDTSSDNPSLTGSGNRLNLNGDFYASSLHAANFDSESNVNIYKHPTKGYEITILTESYGGNRKYTSIIDSEIKIYRSAGENEITFSIDSIVKKEGSDLHSRTNTYTFPNNSGRLATEEYVDEKVENMVHIYYNDTLPVDTSKLKDGDLWFKEK